VSPSISIPPHDVPLASDAAFPPIADYAFLSDCQTGALVAPDGSIEWMCAPRFDSPSVFGALLDRAAGHFRVGPYGIVVPNSIRYLPGTMILETTWGTPSGWLIVRDAMTIGPWRGSSIDEGIHTRPPTDNDADHVFIRTLECIQGVVQVEAVCEPMFGYGDSPGQWEMLGDGWHTAQARDHDLKIGLTSDLRVGIEGNRVRARHSLSEGEQRFVRSGCVGIEAQPRLRRIMRREHARRQRRVVGKGGHRERVSEYAFDLLARQAAGPQQGWLAQAGDDG